MIKQTSPSKEHSSIYQRLINPQLQEIIDLKFEQRRKLRVQRQKYQDIINQEISDIDKQRYQKGLKQLGILEKYKQERSKQKSEKIKDIFDINRIRRDRMENINYNQLLRKYGQKKHEYQQFMSNEGIDELTFQLTNDPNNRDFKNHQQRRQLSSSQSQQDQKNQLYYERYNHYKGLIEENKKNVTYRKFFDKQNYGFIETPYYKKYINVKDDHNQNSYDKLVQNIKSGVYVHRDKTKSSRTKPDKDKQIKSILGELNSILEKKSYGTTFRMLKQTNIEDLSKNVNLHSNNSDFC